MADLDCGELREPLSRVEVESAQERRSSFRRKFTPDANIVRVLVESQEVVRLLHLEDPGILQRLLDINYAVNRELLDQPFIVV